MKNESYNDRKKMINKYEQLDVDLRRRLKEAARYSHKGVNPVRLCYKIMNHLDTDEAISDIYGLSIEDVKKIKNTKAK